MKPSATLYFIYCLVASRWGKSVKIKRDSLHAIYEVNQYGIELSGVSPNQMLYHLMDELWKAGYNEEDFTMINGKVEEGTFFTDAELQYLKGILKDRINEDELTRKSVLETAKVYKRVGDPFSKHCFKMHRKVKADLKKLVKIQQKLKHSLITMG